ncbi:molybdopterin-containing oxidoreductase family protein [Motiliproteus sediminis]|uniref:molybdopterin-containing oxidoreductase family protein n=1 Tax=Motiliproteus sediminis TaxID=1468178 RepID=UPI001AEFE11B|nr:molybdopterin oxidoreductase family protein [Motiliproteus sediminis]
MTSAFFSSTCPHDCPSACALKVERRDDNTIGRIHGDKSNPFTAGVICAKVARYAERVHHPGRLRQPLRRTGAKGSGQFKPISWDQALDLLAQQMNQVAETWGAEAVWPYFYAGTMGQVQRGSINRLRNLMGYSGQLTNICTAIGYAGWKAGTGKICGTDPRELVDSDLIVLWGCNAVATQVNTMTHIALARKRGARLVVVDPYRNHSADKADLHLALKPGSDGALATAMMHVLFRDQLVDREYMARYTDDPAGLEAHLIDRTPAWAAPLTGLSVAEIEHFARLYGRARASFIRIGLGMSRQRNGAVNVHAVSCLPALTGAWQERGGGALLATSDLFHLDKTLIEASDHARPVRQLDMCRIGAVLAGEPADLQGGPPVKAMLVQNSNPATVAPESARVRQGLLREDLFLCVHEQFMTDTALLADLVLPATTFLEHDDLYTSYGQPYLQLGLQGIEPLGEARSNHWLINQLARRLGAEHVACGWSERELIDATLLASGYPDLEQLDSMGRLDCSLPSEQMRFLDGFAQPDGRFRLRPDWPTGEQVQMPEWPDYWPVNEGVDQRHPLRLITPPARHFLNSSFTETDSSRAREQQPKLLINPGDAAEYRLSDQGLVRVGNTRGEVLLVASFTDRVPSGLVVVEGIWPGRDFVDGVGINALVGADAPLPGGGAAFHDVAVWVRSAG